MRAHWTQIKPLAMATPILAAAVCFLPSCTVEQILIGQHYTFYTPPAGACPRLEWRFVVNAQRSIGGFLARDGQPPIADLSGRLDADDRFEITATTTTGHRQATATGQFTSLVSTLSIHGDAAGSACDGQTFALRLGRYFASQGGGGGGGG